MEKLYGKQLEIMATKARLLGLDAVHTAASGHIGGSLSAMDILTTLYFNVMQVDPANPQDPDRDRFVLSKGHCTPALYPVLSLRGFFPQEDLKLFRSIKGHYSGHPDMRHVKGVDMSTGSLGQGISAAVGMALAGKLDQKDYRVYTLLGDGEIEEGQVWEAAMFAAHKKLDNLCVIVDYNGLQIDGPVDEVGGPSPIDKKFEAFGFDVVTINGNDFEEIEKALDHAKTVKGKPCAIVAKTIKGKGVSYMENNVAWHGSAPNKEQYDIAMGELEAALKELEA
mgnify:CR=1 FL=1